MDASGEITDIEILQPKDFEEQMLFYSKHYHFLNVED
jgi:dipeptidyl-peptidase III